MARAYSHPNFRDRKTVTMYLDETPFDLSGDDMHVYLEKPIMRWTLSQVTDPEFLVNAYEILNGFLGVIAQIRAQDHAGKAQVNQRVVGS